MGYATLHNSKTRDILLHKYLLYGLQMKLILGNNRENRKLAENNFILIFMSRPKDVLKILVSICPFRKRYLLRFNN